MSWRLRYWCPDKARFVMERIPDGEKRPEVLRVLAIKKSEDLRARARALEEGAPRATGAGLKALIDRYYADQHRLAERTVDMRTDATDKLIAWCTPRGIRSVDDLTKARLLSYRGDLSGRKRKRQQEGGGWADSDVQCSPHTVNIDLSSLRTVLLYLSDADLMPRLTRAQILIGTKNLKVPVDPHEPLKPKEIATLLAACLRHDDEDQHGRLRPKVAAFILFLLLTGLRIGEARSLDWADVDLDARDPSGAECGVIKVRAAKNKNQIGRVVSLDVSPSLRALLAEMKKASGGGGLVWFPKHAKGGRAVAYQSVNRLCRKYEAPKFTPHSLRATCASYLTNAAAIYGGAAPYHSSLRMGHSMEVAQKHYLGLLRGYIPSDATTLEAAMGIKSLVATILRRAGVPAVSRAPRGDSVGRRATPA